MLESLKFVHGAVSEKDIVPVLTHFHIADGRVQGSNGRLVLDSPIAGVPGDIVVPADKFLKAVDTCNGSPNLEIGEMSLTISAGRFKAKLPMMDVEFPHTAQATELRVPVDSQLLTALRSLKPFISTDATRQWACGVLLADGYAYATNNIVLARAPAPDMEQDISLPVWAVDELLRIGTPPESMCMSESTLSFFWSNGAWMQTKLGTGEWPKLGGYMPDDYSGLLALPEGFAKQVKWLTAFCPDPDFPVVALNEDGISTADGATTAEISGYTFAECKFHAKMLLLVLESATSASFEQAPALWKGNDVEGVIVGVL